WSVAHSTNSATAASAGTVAGASRSDPVSLAVIAPTIILRVEDPADLVSFYDEAYSSEPAEAALYARWRALGAVGKAEHVIALCARAGVRPASTLEVGCGDGALLSELHRRGFGGALSGVEITDAAVQIARTRSEIEAVDLYDGLHLPVPDGTYELGIFSHVLQHVPAPAAARSPGGTQDRRRRRAVDGRPARGAAAACDSPLLRDRPRRRGRGHRE